MIHVNVIDNIVIRNENIALRLITPDDTDKIIAWRNNPEVRKNFIYQKPFTREIHEQWIESMVEQGKAVQFIINDIKAILFIFFIILIILF